MHTTGFKWLVYHSVLFLSHWTETESTKDLDYLLSKEQHFLKSNQENVLVQRVTKDSEFGIALRIAIETTGSKLLVYHSVILLSHWTETLMQIV